MNDAAIVRALEAIEDGELDLARALLEQALAVPPAELGFRCECGRRFRFPGELDDHQASGLCWRARHAA